MKIPSQKFNPLKDRRGYTAIIALALSLVIMYFAMDVGRNIQTQGRNIQAFKDSSRAYFLADSFVRNLMSEGKGYDAGWNVDKDDCGFDPAEDFSARGQFINTDKLGAAFMESLYMTEGVTTLPLETVDEIKKIKIKCSVVGVTGKIADEYVVPSPNTGDAGKECGPVTASEALGDIDHSCNWGRLNFGNQYSSRVAVPLYYYEDDGTDVNIKDPDENGMNELKIKVRTPCKPVEDTEGHRVFVTECENEDRYELDDGGGSNDVKKNPTVVMWQISGECVNNANGESEACSIIPWNKRDDLSPNNRDLLYNSEIHAKLINDALRSGNSIIDITQKIGVDLRYMEREKRLMAEDSPETPYYYDSIYAMKFLQNSGIWFGQTIEKPLLQLQLIANKLYSNDLIDPENVPYLEYQIVSDEKISNYQTEYSVEVQYNGQAYKIERSVPQKKDLIDFAVQN